MDIVIQLLTLVAPRISLGSSSLNVMSTSCPSSSYDTRHECVHIYFPFHQPPPPPLSLSFSLSSVFGGVTSPPPPPPAENLLTHTRPPLARSATQLVVQLGLEAALGKNKNGSGEFNREHPTESFGGTQQDADQADAQCRRSALERDCWRHTDLDVEVRWIRHPP